MEGGCKWDWGFRRKGGEQYARISARRAGRVRREKLWMWVVERIEMRRGGDRGRRARDSGRVEKMDRQGKIQEGVDLLAHSTFSAAESRRTPCSADLTLGRVARRQAINLPRRAMQCCLITSV